MYVWAEVKYEVGENNAALELTKRARAAQNQYAAYAEIAALYFTLAWQKAQPILRSPFESVTTARDTTEQAAPSAPDTAKKAEQAIPDAVAREAK